ncbi:MAG: hypothetical protein Q8K79_08800 [Solirubrobacteraceae bacterium]|nr:hypothetical protein [Solirubrobacteraceae bacterium]
MPERDDFVDLPALARFGVALDEAARRPEPPRRPTLRLIVVWLLALLGIGATAAATVAALRSTVIQPPDPAIVAADQTPLASSVALTTPHSPDPAGGPPWGLRLTRSETGQTCTTVGQIRDGVFGIVGQDGTYRQIPTPIADACGRGLLLGSRIVSAATPGATRSIVYGVVGTTTRRVTLVTTRGRRTLTLGERGSFVAALRGYPEDSASSVELTAPDGRVTRHDLGARPGLVPDIAGAPAWRLQRYVLGTRRYCAHLSDARGPADRFKAATTAGGGRASVPTACIAPHGRFDWAASALRLRPGQKGSAGFDRWDYGQRPPRTLLLGVARASRTIAEVIVTGAGAPRTLTPTSSGVFALLLPASVDPQRLRLTVRLKDGTTQRGRPGHGVVADVVASRRPR